MVEEKVLSKEKRLNEWVYEQRKRLYHEHPRVVTREDIELVRITDREKELEEKIMQRQRESINRHTSQRERSPNKS
jgi:hypothetical protein